MIDPTKTSKQVWLAMAEIWVGLPWWLSGKESTCNAGDTGGVGTIPGSGRSPREESGNPLQYSCWEIPWTESLMGYSSQGHKELDTTEWLSMRARNVDTIQVSARGMEKSSSRWCWLWVDDESCMLKWSLWFPWRSWITTGRGWNWKPPGTVGLM